jgi:hypothetical protein
MSHRYLLVVLVACGSSASAITTLDPADASVATEGRSDGPAAGDSARFDEAQKDASADAASAHDANGAADAHEITYTLKDGQCLSLATRVIGDADGGSCGDFTVKGAHVPVLVGVDGTLCALSDTYPNLASVPTSAEFCGRVISLDRRTNAAFVAKVDSHHVYRVHVKSSDRTVVLSFDQVP